MRKFEMISFLVLLLLVIGLALGLWYFYGEWKVYKQNQDNFMTNQSRELQLTKKELKEALDDRTKAIIDSMGFKQSQIDHYIQTVYHLHDTTIYHSQTVYDSLKDRYNFKVLGQCMQITGYVKPKVDTISITSFDMNDTLDIFQYHAWDHKFLFIKWNRYDVAGVYSRCKNDTIKVVKNYQRRKK